jgi:O-antigen/teichoic acid export membrane protein
MLRQGGFLRSALVLVSGAAFAHVITAIALPILTRLYTPDDFSTLAVFASLTSIFAVSACLRFDIAIPMPAQNEEAFNLLTLAMGCLVIVSLLIGVVLFIAPFSLPALIGRLDLQPYLWLIPTSIFLMGAYSALQNWFVREKAFTLIARSRIAQSAACAGTQIGLASFGSGTIGLIFGYLLNTGAACLILGARLLSNKQFWLNVKKVNVSGLTQAWRNYSLFPKYSTWEALTNSAAIQLPIIIIAAITVGPEAGYLLLAISVIQAPMALFGTAIGQVYLSRAPEAYRQNRLGEFTAEVLGGLIKAGVGPLIAIGIVSPMLFETVFGEGWGRAGVLVAWMTPWFILQFLVSPVSMALHVTGNQRIAFILQLFGLIIRISSVLLATQFIDTPVSEAYALSGAIIYLIYLWLALSCAKCTWVEIFRKTLSGLYIILAWTGVSLLFIMAWIYLI